MKNTEKQPQNLNDVELHQEIFNLLPPIITGLETQKKLLDLLMANRPYVEQSLTDTVLEHRHYIAVFMKYYQYLYTDCEKKLEAAGIDPYQMTAEEEKEFNKEFPDPYRWRVPAWLRKPITKFFKSLFKSNNNENKAKS